MGAVTVRTAERRENVAHGWMGRSWGQGRQQAVCSRLLELIFEQMVTVETEAESGWVLMEVVVKLGGRAGGIY